MALWTELRRQLVHPSTGIVNDLIELQVNPEDPDLHFFATQLSDLEGWTGFSYVERTSAAGRTRQEAVVAALGEAVERYAAAVSLHEAGELVWATWGELGESAIDPRRFALYANEQYGQNWPFDQAQIDVPMRWARGWSLTHKRSVLVPAQFVYQPFDPLPGEPTLLLHASTGTACGEHLEHAAISSLCEVIERDAFMIHWLCRLPAPRVDLASDPVLQAELLARYNRPGILYHVFDFTTDIGVPTYFAAVVENGSANTSMAVGAATRPLGSAAARKALMESVQTRVWLRQMARSEGLRRFDTWDHVSSFEDHVHLWGSPELLPHADFLLKTEASVPLRNDCPAITVSGQIDWVVERLAARDLEAIIVDITPSDIRSLGLTVVRAVIPGCIPLSSDHRFEPLGGRRLYSVPQLLGYRSPKSVADFNPVPHPFP